MQGICWRDVNESPHLYSDTHSNIPATLRCCFFLLMILPTAKQKQQKKKATEPPFWLHHKQQRKREIWVATQPWCDDSFMLSNDNNTPKQHAGSLIWFEALFVVVRNFSVYSVSLISLHCIECIHCCFMWTIHNCGLLLEGQTRYLKSILQTIIIY